MSTLQMIEQALAAGRVDTAVAAARELLASDPNNSGGALRELGGALARAYRALHAGPVHAVRDALAPELGPDRTTMLLQPLQADLDLTEKWCRLLETVASERLANDLLERIKSNDLAGAEQAILSILGAGAGTQAADLEGASSRRARMVGSLLGGMVMERERAEGVARSVVRNPQKFGIDFMAATDLEEEFARTQTAAARRERPAAAVARTELVQATVELGRALPQRMVMADPTEEQIELFDRTLRSLFRCALASPGHSWLHEVTLLMVEFSPKEVSAAGALAGVEQRLYATLGRTARVVAAQGLKAIGHDPVAWPAYFEFARHRVHDRIGRYETEALGLLANEEATPFLIEAMADRKAGVRTEAIFALGSMGDPRAQSALLGVLEQDLRGRVVEGDARRDAAAIISALGRGARASSDTALRDQIAARVIRSLPKDDTEFMVRAVLNFFTTKIESMDPALVEWAAKAGTSALWSIDRPELARAGKAAALGFRQPLLDLLGRLAPHAYATINETALALAKSYSGAYLALGEFYAKHPDPRALPVLRQLLTNTFMHDDSGPRSMYVKEQVLDTATETRQDLDKDRVVASLVYAVDKIGGEEAEAILANLYEQVQAGRLERPGPETADILMQAHMKAAKARTGGVLPSFAEETSRARGYDGGDIGGGGVAAAQVTEDDLRHIADLEASYLLSAKRRAKKVGALAALGPRKVAAAAQVIVHHLTDKDPIIAAAAMTAVSDMVSPPAPAPVVEQVHAELLRMLESGDMDTRIKASDALSRIGPQRSPLKEKLEAIRSRPDVPLALRAFVDKLLTPAAGAGRGSAAGGAGAEDAGGGIAPGGAMSDLDKKRQYMVARQAWIRGGKRGPEPVPPE